MTLTDEQLTDLVVAKLRTLAEANQIHDWRADLDMSSATCGEVYGYGHSDEPLGRIAECTEPNQAAFIAAASPSAVLALLDRLEMAEAKAEVIGGQACLEERARGGGPCGACAVCCDEARRALNRLSTESARLRELQRRVGEKFVDWKIRLQIIADKHLGECSACNYDKECTQCEVDDGGDAHSCNCGHGQGYGWQLDQAIRLAMLAIKAGEP